MPRAQCAIAVAVIACCTQPAAADPCSAETGEQRVALLELYTSEGCSSCPPADRWVSGLPGRGFTPDRIVTLSFHVDYWNYLGWPDPYSKSQFSERQKAASLRNRTRFVYTPQTLLNGRDYRRGTFFDDLGDRIGTLARDRARARISLSGRRDPAGGLRATGAVTVAETSARPGTHAYLALYENNLSNHVTAGENRGERLRHDFVVRELAGPYPLDSRGTAALDHRFDLDPRWKTADLNVAAFVQNEVTGDVLQAVAMPYCG